MRPQQEAQKVLRKEDTYTHLLSSPTQDTSATAGDQGTN